MADAMKKGAGREQLKDTWCTQATMPLLGQDKATTLARGSLLLGGYWVSTLVSGRYMH